MHYDSAFVLWEHNHVTRCSFIHRKDGRRTHEHQFARFEINIQGESTGYLRDVIQGPSIIRSHRQDIGVRCHIAQCPSGFHLRDRDAS
jgi:hypothetical protein